ncbi:MAG: 16S rRNA (cytosine(1402)-N(4))-methyltransferase RsmH [Candidatus Doudnabacteria bacterium]|nr:16S rRNA (cytosine(1402)-N(4))-methyltransferase RsmH [Candidatus Doudnabacteria bacterium]
MLYDHIPVLLQEVISYLKPGSDENFVDATLGGGGYSLEILKHTEANGKVLGIDLDTVALENFKLQIQNYKINADRVVLHHGNFQHIDKIVKSHNFENISGIVADIGLSSFELDQSGRGFSFQKSEPLDMRFNQSQPEDAAFYLHSKTEAELRKIFEDFGEEKFAGLIAKKITQYKLNKLSLKQTRELYEVIKDALPKPFKHKADDSARRIFQALRIAVNHELENLQEFLPKAFNILRPGGRLVVVSFHSLEDRIVKQYFNGLSKGCVCPPEFPMCICGQNPQAKILTKKPVIPSEAELEKNSRSKPAKLRAIVKN